MFKLITLSAIFSGLVLSTSPTYASSDEVATIKNTKTISITDNKKASLNDKYKKKKKTVKAQALKYSSININTASLIELSTGLKSIGKKKAKAIIDYRTKNGKFTNLSDLLNVKGIGKKTLKKNTNRIRFEGKPTI